MRQLKRWMFAAPIALSMIGSVSANENPVVPDADAAASAVAEAEAAVKRAGVRRALWTSAEDALRKARRALQEGNTTAALEQARLAQMQSALGIAQQDYPPFR
jgi:predicted metal-dependent hydrolase